MDSIYRVSFFKKLTDSTGHPASPCQGTIDVRASCEEVAIESARRQFAELADVAGWWLRADYEEVELLPARKRASIVTWRRSRGDHSGHLEAPRRG